MPAPTLDGCQFATGEAHQNLDVPADRAGAIPEAGMSDILLLVGRQTLAVARRILLESVRQRRSLVFWAVFPALMLLLFGLVYGSRPQMRNAFDATPAGILIGAALFFSCLGGTVSILVAERERRTLRRLLISPLQPVAYFAGIVLALSVVAAVQAVIVFGLGRWMGAHYQGSVALGILITALSVFAYVGLGFFFGARLARRAEDVNGPIAAFGVPLLVLAGTFFPPSLLPPTLLQVAWFNPVYHMNEALKSVAANGAGWAAVRTSLAFLVVFAALSLVAGIASYRRMLRQERAS
jgi:ABC-2 type transport system permease protein